MFAALAANPVNMAVKAAGALHFMCADWERDNAEDPEAVDSHELPDLIHPWRIDLKL